MKNLEYLRVEVDFYEEDDKNVHHFEHILYKILSSNLNICLKINNIYHDK